MSETSTSNVPDNAVCKVIEDADVEDAIQGLDLTDFSEDLEERQRFRDVL